MKAVILAIVFAALLPTSAHATLGEAEDSIAYDQTKLAIHTVRRNSRVHSAFVVHELVSDSGVIREYVATGRNVIFAACWNGLTHPNFETLFGSRYSDYKITVQNQPRIFGRRFNSVLANSIQVKTSGHMGNIQGCALDSSLLPSGVQEDEIQ